MPLGAAALMRARAVVARAVVAVLAALAFGAAGALAATVDVYVIEGGNKSAPHDRVEFAGAAGERNDLTLTADSNGVTFRDAAAPVTARSRCSQVDEHTARCGSRGAVYAFLGDLDDHSLTGGGLIFGGAGDDVLEGEGTLMGEAGADVIRGGPGNGDLDGGTGSDSVLGGGGDDTLSGGLDDAPDVLDGGPGHDELDYVAENDVMVDLAAGRSVVRGAEERISGIESVTARSGSFRGDDRRNQFSALGPATMFGGAGSDELDADDPGVDVLDGGSGNDQLWLASYGARDRVRCGPGSDVLHDPAVNTLVPVDCERVVFGGDGGADVALRRAGAAEGMLASLRRWSGFCNREEASRCRIAVSVHEAVWPDRARRASASRRLGAAAAVVTRDRQRIDVHANDLGRRVLGSGRCVLALLRLSGPGVRYGLMALHRFGSRCRATAPLAP